jgi:small subunit ribosomal protein S17e
MGANKPAYIKRAGEEILNEHGDRFTEDFVQNKKALDDLVIIKSKEVRHRVAGYITRRKKAEKRMLQSQM